MDASILKLFREKTVNLSSSLKEFKGIGDYLYKRLKDTLKINGTVTVNKFLKKFENKTSREVTAILKIKEETNVFRWDTTQMSTQNIIHEM